MMPHYPHFIGAQNIIPQARGITEGTDDSAITEKKVWKDAEARAIEDNRENRELGYSLDALTLIITKVQTYSILGSFQVHSADDEKYSELVKEVSDWVTDTKILKTFRKWFPDIVKHGYVASQKLYENNTRMQGEPKGLTALQQLVGVIEKKNPFNSEDRYLYQKLKILEDWKDPENEADKDKKVWYIKGGMENVSNYKAIKPANIGEDPNRTTGDIVVDLDDIIEIKNNESGDIPISACLNEIYIKNLIMLNLPNLVYLIVAPGIELTTKSFIESKDGVIWKAPQYPDSALQETNKEEYDRQKTDYDTYQSNMQTIVNTLWDNWLKKGIMSHSDQMSSNVMESNKAMNPEMLNVIVHLLNTEIAFALGFPLSLLDAKGAELATARNIFTTISTMLKGIQDQYQSIALDLIYEQFPKAQEAGITFTLSELNPKDAKDLAEVGKVHAAILKIYKEIGASDNDLKALSRKYNLLDEPELGGEGLVKGMGEASMDVYPESDMEAAMKIVHRIAEDKKTIGIVMEELE
mgnify:CR=1 FL=1